MAGVAVLRHLGFDVKTAENGQQGVDLATSAADDYRVVLLDLTMPKLDGHAALLAIRQKRPALPVVLMSGHHDQRAADLSALGGRVAFIQKPFSLAGLVSTLQPLLAL